MTALDTAPTAPPTISQRIKVIDADSHVTEPPDVWSSRLTNDDWAALIPEVRRHPSGKDRWFVDGKWASGVADLAFAGWNEFPPSYPPALDQADAASWEPNARLAKMTEYGIHAQVLYPNLLGFASVFFLGMADHELRNWCVSTYNDYIAEFASTDANRLLPLMWLPFWDVELAVKELERSAKRGHKGIIFPSNFAPIGFPLLPDEHWYPVWEAAQHHDMTINFHSGFQTTPDEARKALGKGASRADFTKECSLLMLGNARTIADVVVYGVCEKFPKVNFVSVESGFGWMPFFSELLDWQWLNSGAQEANTHMPLLPSEYIDRQVYGTFWFERECLVAMADDGLGKNAMFSTDFPHPTSLTPGPKSTSAAPQTAIENNFGTLSEETVSRLLHDNAARLYHVD